MPQTIFLNVDFDLHANFDLKELLEAFGDSVINLNPTNPDFTSLELSESFISMEETIEKFYDLVQGLPPKARALWDNCEKRIADIGIEAGTEHSKRFTLSAKTIQHITEMKLEIVITVYGIKKADT